MVVIGFGFKIAAVPFHLWAPDAYSRRADAQRRVHRLRPAKVASFFIFAKVMALWIPPRDGNSRRSSEWRAALRGTRFTLAGFR